MPATKKTKVSEETKHECDNSTNLKHLIDLSRSFTREIENIMTTTGLGEGNRASLLGTATKHFAAEVERLAK
ncbi:MAG: hypothetical protein CL816_01560 [Coxiellaceae bacterium]|nr:hypothetical protein [Coxiellaceae bacterium]|tara:strand:- start:612 stop:827 length:216 start_codon:yes stop_codon:yes gene_type:complete